MKKINRTIFVKGDIRLMGENNYRWNNSNYAGWQRAQRMYKIQPCDFCNSTHRIHRHHKDGNKLNNSRENIMFLCSKHHIEEEKKLGTVYGVPRKIVASSNELENLRIKLGSWKKVASVLGVTERAIHYRRLDV